MFLTVILLQCFHPHNNWIIHLSSQLRNNLQVENCFLKSDKCVIQKWSINDVTIYCKEKILEIFYFIVVIPTIGILRTIIAERSYAALFIISQETNNVLELVEKMNTRVAEEYKGFGDVASGLTIFVEQLKCKSGRFDEYVQQIDTIEQQVTEFEAVISMLDKYVSLLESKVQSAYQIPPPWVNSSFLSFCFHCITRKPVPWFSQTWVLYVIIHITRKCIYQPFYPKQENIWMVFFQLACSSYCSFLR